jgi:hypothetical protein
MAYQIQMQFIPENDQIWVQKLEINDPIWEFDSLEETQQKMEALDSADTTGRKYRIVEV